MSIALAPDLRATQGPEVPLRFAPTDLVVGASLLWWAVGLVQRSGGRDAHITSVGLVLTACALLAERPWRRLPIAVSMILLAIPLAALVVCATAPTGWRGANEVGSWALAAALAAIVGSWAVDTPRRLALLALVLIGGAASFAAGWMAWWGGGDPSHAFLGTFYWHNQEGVLLATSAVVGLGLAVRPERLLRLLGTVLTPLCAAGTVLTTSRGSMLALALGAGLLVALHARDGQAGRAIAAAGLMGAVSALLAFALTGPPFFPARVSPGAGTAARSAAGETVTANGGYRLHDWELAARVARHWPATGAGFHGFAAASVAVDPQRTGARTPFAHNGYLQTFAEGGVVLGLPVLLALGLLGVQVRRRFREREAVALVAVPALLVLLLHSGMDFDWSYPALLAAPALLAGVVTRPVLRQRGRPADVLGAVLVIVVFVGAIAAWPGLWKLSVPFGGSS